jgi:hypothetical protein
MSPPPDLRLTPVVAPTVRWAKTASWLLPPLAAGWLLLVVGCFGWAGWLVAGWLLVGCCWLLPSVVSQFRRLPGRRCRCQLVGCWLLLVAGCWLLLSAVAAACWLSPVGCWLLFACWLLLLLLLLLVAVAAGLVIALLVVVAGCCCCWLVAVVDLQFAGDRPTI